MQINENRKFCKTSLSCALFSTGKGFLNDLTYHISRKKTNKANIEDVFDGKLYRDHFQEDGTPEGKKGKEFHISFQLNTDGLALFKSTN